MSRIYVNIDFSHCNKIIQRIMSKREFYVHRLDQNEPIYLKPGLSQYEMVELRGSGILPFFGNKMLMDLDDNMKYVTVNYSEVFNEQR